MANSNVTVYLNNGIVCTNNPKTFLRLAEEFDFSECGVAFTDEAKQAHGESEIKFESPEKSVEGYKLVVDMIQLNEIQRLKMENGLLQKIREDVLKPDSTYLSSLALLWLFSGRDDLGYTGLVVFLAVLGSIDIVEAVKICKSLLTKEIDREKLDKKLFELGLIDYAYACEKTDDVSLYLKLSKGFKTSK